MKTNIQATFRCRARSVGLLLVSTLVLVCAAAVWAQPPGTTGWPTTRWVVKERPQETFVNEAIGMFGKPALLATPSGERGRIADKHERLLSAASIWYQSLGFPAPFQWTEDLDLDVDADEAYLATLNEDATDTSSSHSVTGLMTLTSHPEFLVADTPLWRLMEVSAVHELYHAIQISMSPSLVRWVKTKPPAIPGCRGDGPTDWLGEGTAAMIQIRWLEGTRGGSWGHPFKGSPRAAWVRHFDQPIHRGAIPPEHQVPRDSIPMSWKEAMSWGCSYGTWYFWYAIGDMIGRSDTEKVAYTRYLFTVGRAPWDDGGIANVDAGLRAAAAAYDAIRPYRGGLYDLYPQFVAQYLDEDRFYGKLEEVTLDTPDLYQTSSVQSGGPLEPLATRAWRFRVPLPRDASRMPYNIRFTVDAPDGTDRDDLHLIVDERVIPRPVDSSAPYADVQQTHLATPAADGAVEYLVRVANVAAKAAESADAGFSLRVEVDGFYGNEVPGSDGSGGLSADDIDRVAGELPPGFDVRGPAPWTCSGSATARAIFDLVTPDERARGYDRSLPQSARNTEDWLDELEIRVKQAEVDGSVAGMTREQLAAFRKQIEGLVETGVADAQPTVDKAAEEARARRTTSLAATFVGRNGSGECQMTLGATLAGREGGAQVVAGAVDENDRRGDEAPRFAVRTYPPEMLRAMRAHRPTRHPLDPRRGDWEVCTMTHAEQQRARALAAQGSCPPVVCTPGRLTLETAEQGRIAGSFQFEVLRWRKDRSAEGCDVPLGRDTVVGHFNVSSTDDGYDDAGRRGMTNDVPGAPIL